MEVLNSSKQVFAVTQWYLSLAFMITSDAFPDICEHQLLLFLCNWADKSEFKEQLRHLSAPNLDFRFVSVGILWLLNNIKFEAGLLEISVESIVDHFVGHRVDLHLWHHRLLLHTCLISLLLLLPPISVLQNSVEIPLHVFGFVTDARIELKIFVLLLQIVFPSHLLFENRVLIHAHRVSKITLAGLSLDFNNPLRSRVDPGMVRLQIHEFLFVRDLLQPGKLALLEVNLVLHELLDRAHIILNDVLVGVNVGKVFDFFSLELFFLFHSSFLLQPPLLCEGIQSLRCIIWVWIFLEYFLF